MKKIFILFCLAVSTLGFSQIKVMESEPCETIGKVKALFDKLIFLEKCGDYYTISYKDVKFTQLDNYKSFSFKDADNALESLYDIILKGFKEQPEDGVLLELPNDNIELKFDKTLGKPYVEIFHFVNKNPQVVGKTTWLDKNRLDKLFGKKLKL